MPKTRYRAEALVSYGEQPEKDACHPELYEWTHKIFTDEASAVAWSIATSIDNEGRVYLEEYRPFYDEAFDEMVPDWEEIETIFADAKNGVYDRCRS